MANTSLEAQLTKELESIRGHSLVNECCALSHISGLTEGKVMQLHQFASDIYWDYIFKNNDYSFNSDKYWIDMILINHRLNQ